jgi:hypothetical protein
LRPAGLFLFQFAGNRTDPTGKGSLGARITAGDLDDGLKDEPYRIREVSIDPNDPIRNVVIVLQKQADGESPAEEDRSFRQFEVIESPWIIGVYDGISTKTAMHERLKKEPDRLTFYDD